MQGAGGRADADVIVVRKDPRHHRHRGREGGGAVASRIVTRETEPRICLSWASKGNSPRPVSRLQRNRVTMDPEGRG